MAIISEARLSQYLKLNLNVLFKGYHGVGKTAIIKQVFDEAGLNWRYFSAPTLDPWVDFVGVPRVTDVDGHQELRLIRPSFIENDEVEAIFFDEFNRAPDKIINAVMELIQFRSINGHKLKNLRVIWAAINPEDEDDTYSVNHLDPAHLDRFHVHLTVPFKPDTNYFTKKFPNIAVQFIEWWQDLPKNIQLLVSPRRLEYACQALQDGCRLEDFLPPESNVNKLRKSLQSVPFKELIKKITNTEEAIAFLADINNTTKLMDLVKLNNKESVEFFTKFGNVLPKELTASFSEIVFVQSVKSPTMSIPNFESFVRMIPTGNGTANTATLINSVDLSLLYINGGSIEKDVNDLHKSNRALLNKLSNRCVDIMIRCHRKTLDRHLWISPTVDHDETKNKTNFHQIILALDKIKNLISSTQRNYINKKMHNTVLGKADSNNFLTGS